MKNFARPILTFVWVILIQSLFAQNFLESELKPGRTYVLLAHPTVQNIQTIQFLLEQNILQLNDVDFVGVYSEIEEYDYSNSIQLISKPEMAKFHLQKISGATEIDQLYKQNKWSETFKKLFEISAGIFFFGGPDIQPEAYRQSNLYSDVTDPNRHSFELSFLFHLLGGKQNDEFKQFLIEKPNYFVSGFCLGLQSMNVATGGSLTQDIPAQIYNKEKAEQIVQLKKNQQHRNYWPELSSDSLFMSINFHQIEYTANSFFTERVNAGNIVNPLVLSSHHQSIYELGKDIIVTATSMDNEVIEAIRHRIYPNVFAVQFHPEVPDLYREGEKLKYTPEDVPKSFPEIIGEQGLEFHKKYWVAISKSIKASVREQKLR
jgi:putative glutamine amidotransferase